MTMHLETLGAGSPLVMLHGWGFHSAVWDGFAELLARRHHVHLFDLPGHGRSREAPFDGVDDVVEELARRIPQGAIVCGWSLGGVVAQRLAARHPGRVAGLALVSTTPCFVARDDWRHGVDEGTLAQFGRDLRDEPHATLRSFLQLNALASPGARATARSLARRLGERPAPSPQALEAGLAALRATDLRRETPSIGVPAVVVHGARDRVVPPAAGAWIAASIAGARHVELAQSAHLPFVTDRDATLEALRFLDG